MGDIERAKAALLDAHAAGDTDSAQQLADYIRSTRREAEQRAKQEVKKSGESDHCAPNLKKSERLRRLALNGRVRETGYETFSTGNYEIVFSNESVIRCR